MSQLSDAMQALTAGWYNTFCQQLHLDPGAFQLVQGDGIPVGTDSTMLWQAMDVVPPDSAVAVWSGSRDTFSSAYGQVLSSLQDPPESDFQKSLGDYYDVWLGYLAKYVRQPGDTYTSIFTAWAQGYFPPEEVDTLVTQLQSDTPVTAARELWMQVGESGAKAYTPAYQWVADAMREAPGATIHFDSSTADTSLAHTWAQHASEVMWGIFGGAATASFEQTSLAVLQGKVVVDMTIDHVLPYVGLPLATVSTDPILSRYKPWYVNGLMADAYRNQDNHDEIWNPLGETSWQDAFGTGGALERVATDLLLVDGISLTITVEASLTTDDQTTVQGAAEAGFFPFYLGAGKAGTSNTVTSADGTGFTATVTCPAGSPLVFGVTVAPAATGLR